MLKKLIYSLAISIVIILVSYTLAWFAVLQLITAALKKHYMAQSIMIADEHFIKFSRVTAAGYPFKIAIKIRGLNEEGKLQVIDYNDPLYIGYDLLKQSFFLSYSGDTIAHYKPLQSGFGSKITNDKYLITIKYPLNYNLIKIIQRKTWFELANFIKELEFTSNKVQIYDLIDQTKLYDKDYDIIKISVVKDRYYTSLEEFLNNIPQRLNISYSSKLNSMSNGRIVAPSSLLYGIFLPYVALNGEASISLKTNATNFKNVFDDWEVEIPHLKSESDIYSLSLSMFYKGNINKDDRVVAFKSSSKIELKTGFIDKLLAAANYLIAYLRNIYPTNNPLKNKMIYTTINNLENIVNNKTKFRFEELENRKYESDIDLYFSNMKGYLYNKINNFSIFSGQTGIRLTNESDLKKWHIQGLTALNNYPKLVDFFSNILYQFDAFQSITDQDKKIYTGAVKHFLKSISDYPKSTSNDITIEYKIDSSNLSQGKIANVELKQLKMLYYLSLYHGLIENTQTTGNNLLTKMKHLAPNISDNELSFFEQLIIKPEAKVDNDAWKQLIK